MHFVKKIPTSAEQQSLMEKERSVKLKNFCQLRDKIFSKRAQSQFDEEMLNLCEAVLAKNPDIYTLWNVRRETLERLRERNIVGDKAVLDEERLNHNELGLTEQCIKANPKSYSAWFQRSWILKRQKHPDFKKELAMCKEGLKFDCRNFHCWDHRRIVAKMANLTDEEELVFSEKLIADNFSNFSAWHMRMSLIPRFEDTNTGEKLMRGTDVKEEIKRVANAIFTDPEDESAWMYARYIINLYSPASFLNKESSSLIVPLSASLTCNRLIIVFTRPTTVDYALNFLRGIPCDASWRAVSLFSSVTSRVWECIFEGSEQIQISKNGMDFEYFTRFYRKDLYDRIMCGGSVDVIDTLREHCEDLLKEEIGNSLAVFTVTQCLRLTSPIESHPVIMQNLDKLAESLDPLRANMYKSMASHERIRRHLMIKEENESKTKLDDMVEVEGRLSLRYLQLTELPSIDLFAPFLIELDLRGNELMEGSEVGLLPLLTHLSIDENPIECLPSSLCSLSRLEFLSCGSTLLTDVSAVQSILQQSPSLKRFLYCETPLVEKTEELRNVARGDVTLIPYYL